ncbi:MAG: hypothetical protein ABII90_02325 [Bacteroidota bacterium]
MKPQTKLNKIKMSFYKEQEGILLAGIQNLPYIQMMAQDNLIFSNF